MPANRSKEKGFTIPEVIVAGILMMILCVGTLTAFSTAIQINRGNNLRMQALSVLQEQVEFYRSIKFVPVGTNPLLLQTGSPHNLGVQNSADGRAFNVSATVTNLPAGTTDANATFKQITITATPVVVEAGWLSNSNLNTTVTLQRVRSN
jgi:type II secretory pathway pseudopilin PulG